MWKNITPPLLTLAMTAHTVYMSPIYPIITWTISTSRQNSQKTHNSYFMIMALCYSCEQNIPRKRRNYPDIFENSKLPWLFKIRLFPNLEFPWLFPDQWQPCLWITYKERQKILEFFFFIIYCFYGNIQVWLIPPLG